MRRSLVSSRLLLHWQYLRFRTWLPELMMIQVLLGVGVIYGLAFLIPNIDKNTALYLATGAPTLSLLILGFNVVPQEVSQGRVAGRYDYWRALPVPRLAPLVSEITFWLMLQLPGTVAALVVASLRFDIGLHVGWAVVPAIALVALTGASVGYALAAWLPPEVTAQITSFLSIGILLFSPINFPADRLPGFMQAIHSVLPVQYMADVIRGSLTGRYDDAAGLAFAVVGAWCALGLALSYRAAVRRP
jgi:ABC-2 type transport system permease protein